MHLSINLDNYISIIFFCLDIYMQSDLFHEKKKLAFMLACYICSSGCWFVFVFSLNVFLVLRFESYLCKF